MDTLRMPSEQVGTVQSFRQGVGNKLAGNFLEGVGRDRRLPRKSQESATQKSVAIPAHRHLATCFQLVRNLTHVFEVDRNSPDSPRGGPRRARLATHALVKLFRPACSEHTVGNMLSGLPRGCETPGEWNGIATRYVCADMLLL